jgi:hypothetical protein
MLPLSLLFKISGFILIVSFIYFLIEFIKTENQNRKWRKIAMFVSIISFAAMLGFVIANAYSDPALAQKTRAGALTNDIYNVLFYATTFMVRTVIFGIVLAAFIYLLKRSKIYPKLTGVKIHQIMLLIGVGIVSYLFVRDVAQCFVSRDYAERILFEKYVPIFVGSIFWMMISSMVLAASLPENKQP